MKLTYRLLELPYEFTFTISRSSNQTARTVLVELEAEINGETHVGLGEATPTPFYHESPESVTTFYDTLIADKTLKTLDPFNIQEMESRLDSYPKNFAAKSAIDMAMYDLQGKILNMPVHKLWGLDPARAPKSSYTIGISDADTIRRKTETALSRNYDVLKLKLGADNDIEMLEIVRDLAPHASLRVDANAAWRVDHALEMCRIMHGFGIEFVEEPLTLDSPDADYERLKAETPLMLMADESCHRLTDIPRCARFFHAINLKHPKTGGLSEARRMIAAAHAHGLKVMLGGFGESSVSTTAFAQLAPLVEYADLDATLLLAEDPFDGLTWEGSRFILPNRPGLGVIPRT